MFKNLSYESKHLAQVKVLLGWGSSVIKALPAVLVSHIGAGSSFTCSASDPALVNVPGKVAEDSSSA